MIEGSGRIRFWILTGWHGIKTVKMESWIRIGIKTILVPTYRSRTMQKSNTISQFTCKWWDIVTCYICNSIDLFYSAFLLGRKICEDIHKGLLLSWQGVNNSNATVLCVVGGQAR
jgi:hypothetical protein